MIQTICFELLDDSSLQGSPICSNDVPASQIVSPDGKNDYDLPQLCGDTEKENSKNESITEDIDDSNVRPSTRPSKVPGECWKASKVMMCSFPLDPRSYKEPLSCPNFRNWKQAMDQENESLIANNTRELFPSPKNQNVLS